MDGDGIRVLVVEDDRDHAELVRRTLTRQHPPFHVAIVGDGAACLEAVTHEAYAVVLLDYSLPGMDGVEVLERMRQRGVPVPVVMVTGQGDERVAVKAMKAGATDYVVKTSGYAVALPTALHKALRQHQLSVENARLYEETQRRLRESEALLALARVLTSTLEYTPLLKSVARMAARVCGMDRCSILVWEDGKVTPVMSQFADGRSDRRLWRAFLQRCAPAIQDTPFFAEVRRGEPVVVDDASRDPRILPSMEIFRFQSLLVLPLIRQDQVVGVLVLDNPAPAPKITPAQIALGTAVASQVALAIENARLYRDAQQALADLQAAQEQLVRGETLRALGELAGGVAHHLNNLLAVISGRVEVLLPKPEVAAVRRPLEIIRRAAKDGAEVVRRIQAFARTRQVEEWEAADLNELARDVVEMTRVRWQDAARAQGVSIEVVCEPGSIPAVPGHPASLREVITNLLLNAIDALPNGGRVHIKTWVDGDMVALSVADDGVGMSEEVVRRAQEPFFTTKGLKSTGLGLSVNYGLVQQHGGELTIDSVPGRGTTVTVRLPIDGVSAPASSGTASGSEGSSSLMVLVIDDEPEVREMLADLIQTEGHTAVQAAGPREGLTQLETGPLPDLVLTDLGMPDMTGWEVAAAVKSRWPQLTVGLITGWGQEPPVAPNARKAVDFILGKPVSGEQLREKFVRVRRHAEAAGPRHALAAPGSR
jgi:signal transduction histidine kinase/CheY-like chemotaxis protein